MSFGSNYRSLCWPAILPVAAILSSCGGDEGGAAPPVTVPSTPPTSLSSGSSGGGSPLTTSARIMENLGRGVVAVRKSASSVFVSWRLLALDDPDIAFNVYRSFNGDAPVKLNGSPLTEGTNFTDTGATNGTSGTYSYTVRPVVDGQEQAASGAFDLAANGPNHPIVRIPISAPPAAGYYTKFAWVGDLDGDGEYDYVIDRLAPEVPGTNGDLGAGPQYLEAYKRDGTRLWQVNMGPGSENIYNVKPGPATLSVGMYDGATVYDLDGDGKAEVVLKIASGVTLPNGTTFTNSDPNKQFVAILDGETGAMLASKAIPTNYYAQAGSMGVQLGIGYADGQTPNIFFWGRNRNADKTFNDIFVSYSWSGGSTISENWVLPLHQATYGGGNPDGTHQEASHQMRIIDVDGDGKDEVATGNFMLNTSNGTIRYILPGVGHGDRFYIGKFNPTHSGMRGAGAQQNHPDGLLEYYYDATNGSLIWSHSVPPAETYDVGRVIVGDIDPRYPGFEVWTPYSGLYSGDNVLIEADKDLSPWAAQMLWWDGDLLSELLNDHKLEKWDYQNPSSSTGVPRLLSLNKAEYAVDMTSAGKNPAFFGDILGDWRTEIVTMGSQQNELVIFTTDIPSSTRLYTMAQNPAYRNHMTIKGYVQSPLPDYYLGTGMSTPPVPNISYAP